MSKIIDFLLQPDVIIFFDVENTSIVLVITNGNKD